MNSKQSIYPATLSNRRALFWTLSRTKIWSNNPPYTFYDGFQTWRWYFRTKRDLRPCWNDRRRLACIRASITTPTLQRPTKRIHATEQCPNKNSILPLISPLVCLSICLFDWFFLCNFLSLFLSLSFALQWLWCALGHLCAIFMNIKHQFGYSRGYCSTHSSLKETGMIRPVLCNGWKTTVWPIIRDECVRLSLRNDDDIQNSSHIPSIPWTQWGLNDHGSNFDSRLSFFVKFQSFDRSQ